MRFTFTLAVAALVASLEAGAARPMITDDARIVDAKACQVESWYRHNENGHELWALSACNPWGNAELTLGAARLEVGGEPSVSDVQMQAKTLFKPLETNGWGIGLAVGTLRHASAREEGARDWYAYAPISYSTYDDRIVWHVNLGWLREKSVDRDFLTWGLATESQIHERVYLVAETFGRHEGKPFYQLGLRFWIVPNRVQLDTTLGDRFGATGERWFSIGMRLLSPPFLP